MSVQASATVSSGEQIIKNVDITPLVTFASSSPLLSVSPEGAIAVEPSQLRSDETSTAHISVEQRVRGTAMKTYPLSVEVSTEEVGHHSWTDLFRGTLFLL